MIHLANMYDASTRLVKQWRLKWSGPEGARGPAGSTDMRANNRGGDRDANAQGGQQVQAEAMRLSRGSEAAVKGKFYFMNV